MFRRIYFAEYKVRSTFYIACRTNGSLPLRGGKVAPQATDEGGCICSPHPLSHSTKEISQKASPWGEENCKQFVAQATDEGGSICTYKRHTRPTYPTHKTSATAALSKKSPPARNKKLPPRAPVPYKAKQRFAMYRRVLLGEVLGERGRFGGREPHLSRGGSLPPRSFSPINKSSCKRGGIGGHRGCCQCP